MAAYGRAMDYTLELIILPVSDVDAAKEFYLRAGFHADHDHTVSDEVRFVQMTPVGSPSSIAFGKGLSQSEPGSVKGLFLVVSDIEQAQKDLTGRGVPISEVKDLAWGRFIYFSDPDGNQWSVQEIVRSLAL
jgi:predicted enzyme related to lactoylglutathione lyase